MKQSLEDLRGTVGLWSPGMEMLTTADLPDFLAELEAQGWPALWFPEAYGREAFTQASLALAGSRSLKIASGIASIHGRDAMATAAAARTLNAASGGRFITGLGVSHRPMVERVRGQRYEKPLSTMTAYLEAMSHAGMMAPEHDEPFAVLIAALGPKMLELAESSCDGALPYLVTPEHTARARAQLKTGFLAVEQAVVLTTDRAEGLRRAHQHLHIYSGLENYRNNWRRLGFGDEDFIPGGSERLAEAMVLIGDGAAIAARVQEHQAAGADHVCLQILSSDGLSLDLIEAAEIKGALS